jgi:hypothetical protein
MSHHESRELRALDRVISILYYGGWLLTAVLLIGLPILVMVSPDDGGHLLHVHVPVLIEKMDATAEAAWRGAAERYNLGNLRGHIEIPVKTAPQMLVVATWVSWALACALMLMMLHQARALVRRARGGAPFDAENAVTLRRLGLLLLAQYIVKAFYVFGTSSWLVGELSASSVPLSGAPYVNWSVLFSALVLLALAGIFRRGAALEHEQSLVV